MVPVDVSVMVSEMDALNFEEPSELTIKNILLLIPTFADEGGTQKMVYELGKLLAEKYTVFECSFDAHNEKHVFKNSNTVLSLESPSATSALKKMVGYLHKSRKLAKLKKKYNIDLTISNLWAADLVSALSGGSDRKISIGHVNIKGNFQNRLLLKLRKFASLIYNKFDKVVAVNPVLMEELQEVFKLQKDKAAFINNFIVLPSHEPAAIIKPSNRLRLVNFGRLNAIKNHLPLIEAFARVKLLFSKVQLVIIGAGPLHHQLIEFSKLHGLSIADNPEEDTDIVFTGFHPDPFSVLASSDIFVFSSRSEGFGLVIVEAMHAGLTVITSDCPTGGPHLILKGKDKYSPGRKDVEETEYGFLMPVPEAGDNESVSKWKDVILLLLKDKAKRNILEEKCKQRSYDFSVDVIKNQWYQLINTLE
jgi:glycosyltransferase involved in cell wall biosynthesis